MDGKRSITRHTASVPSANNEIFNWKTIQGATILLLYFLISTNKSCYAELDILTSRYKWNPSVPTFDPIVALMWNETTIGNGVFISQSSVLTSANIIDRLLSNNVNLTADLTVYSIYEQFHKAVGHKVKCMTSVFKNNALRNGSGFWVRQGFTYDNSPIHDLYVLGLAPTKYDFELKGELLVALTREMWAYVTAVKAAKKYGAEKPQKHPWGWYGVKAVIGSYESIPTEVPLIWEYASFGCCHRNDFEERDGILIESALDARVSCDEWLPREWGHFICMQAERADEVIAAGTPLFYGMVLHGISSFSVTKNMETIHVFTDIRAYRDHLMLCTPQFITLNEYEKNYQEHFAYIFGK